MPSVNPSTRSAVMVGPYRFTATDVRKTFSNLGPWWQHLVTGIPQPVWIDSGRALLAALAPQVGNTSATAADPGTGLAQAGRSLAAHAAEDVNTAAVQHALTSLWNGVFDLTRTLRVSGAIATSGSGTLAQINVSGGGVPKRPVAAASIDWAGVRGDRQGARTHHGRPWQALCIWAGEVIDAFASEGHPIAPGCAGENFTVRGLDWSTIRPGVRLRIGSTVVETSAWAIPCAKNAPWFADGDFRRLSHERGPTSRIYATVIEPGEVAAGDTITLER